MKILLAILISATMASCSSLNSVQKTELKEWQAQNLDVQDKNPPTAAALNILPGIGDFYNGNVGLGVVNLLTWPLSILWAPVGGATGAEEINYYSTKRYVEQLEKNKDATRYNIDQALYFQKITRDDHAFATRKLENMDLKDFKKPQPAEQIIPFRTPSSQKIN